MRVTAAGALLAATLSSLAAAPVPAAEGEPAPARCGDTGVGVRGASAGELEDICAGVRDALAFFAPFDLDREAELLVDVRARLPADGPGASAVGHYVREGRRVIVLGREPFLELGTFLGLPADRALHRAVVAHEVAHAVLDRQFPDAPPSERAFEYVGAVVMLATMEPRRRERILADVSLAGYADESEISLLYYLIAPVRFTVKAYRHYLRADAGADFVAAVLAGEALRGPAAW